MLQRASQGRSGSRLRDRPPPRGLCFGSGAQSLSLEKAQAFLSLRQSPGLMFFAQKMIYILVFIYIYTYLFVCLFIYLFIYIV